MYYIKQIFNFLIDGVRDKEEEGGYNERLKSKTRGGSFTIRE
jgi:hypothetical protein